VGGKRKKGSGEKEGEACEASRKGGDGGSKEKKKKKKKRKKKMRKTCGKLKDKREFRRRGPISGRTRLSAQESKGNSSQFWRVPQKAKETEGPTRHEKLHRGGRGNSPKEGESLENRREKMWCSPGRLSG